MMLSQKRKQTSKSTVETRVFPAGAIPLKGDLQSLFREKFNIDYIPSSRKTKLNKNEKFPPKSCFYIHTVKKLEVKDTKEIEIRRPYGLFTNQFLTKNTFIGYTGLNEAETIKKRKELKIESTNSSYLCDMNRVYRDAEFAGNEARFCNHSYDPNCNLVIRNGEVGFLLNQDVHPFEQLTADYGTDYDIELEYSLCSIRPDDNHETDEIQFKNKKNEYQENIATGSMYPTILKMINLKIVEEKTTTFSKENTRIFSPKKWEKNPNNCVFIQEKNTGKVTKTNITLAMYLCFNFTSQNEEKLRNLFNAESARNKPRLNEISFHGFSAIRLLLYGELKKSVKKESLLLLIEHGAILDLKLEEYHTPLWDFLNIGREDLFTYFANMLKKTDRSMLNICNKKNNLYYKAIECNIKNVKLLRNLTPVVGKDETLPLSKTSEKIETKEEKKEDKIEEKSPVLSVKISRRKSLLKTSEDRAHSPTETDEDHKEDHDNNRCPLSPSDKEDYDHSYPTPISEDENDGPTSSPHTFSTYSRSQKRRPKKPTVTPRQPSDTTDETSLTVSSTSIIKSRIPSASERHIFSYPNDEVYEEDNDFSYRPDTSDDEEDGPAPPRTFSTTYPLSQKNSRHIKRRKKESIAPTIHSSEIIDLTEKEPTASEPVVRPHLLLTPPLMMHPPTPGLLPTPPALLPAPPALLPPPPPSFFFFASLPSSHPYPFLWGAPPLSTLIEQGKTNASTHPEGQANIHHSSSLN